MRRVAEGCSLRIAVILPRTRISGSRDPLGPSARINLLILGALSCRSMTQDEMHGLAKNFADSATFGKKEGFDAVELHMGHGYLLSQFLSPRINRRTYWYGGSVTNRLRFPLEVLEAVRQAVGEDLPCLLQDQPGGWSQEG